MKCGLLVFALVCLPYVCGEGFFSRLLNRGKKEATKSNQDYVDVCETVKVMPRIALAVVGGSPLKSENSAPYIAAVGERLSNGTISWFCGGSLISPQHVLTAAHCLVSRNVTTVRVGSFSTKKRSTEDDYEIAETIIHPAYKITQSYNDIAIIKVKDKIKFSSNIKPVCLPQNENDTYEKERAKVIGWGAEEFGGEGTHKLQQVEVEVFTNSNCEKAYSNSTIAPKNFPKGITKEQLCAGSSKGGKDACQGDSGGPLVLTDENSIVRQIGIVSTGAGCGFKAYPGVYARVSSYTDWIQKQIKKTGSSNTRQNKEQTSHNKISGNGHSSKLTEETNKRPSQSTGHSSKQTNETNNRPSQSTGHSQKNDERNNEETINLLNLNSNINTQHNERETSRERYTQDKPSQQYSNSREQQSNHLNSNSNINTQHNERETSRERYTQVKPTQQHSNSREQQSQSSQQYSNSREQQNNHPNSNSNINTQHNERETSRERYTQDKPTQQYSNNRDQLSQPSQQYSSSREQQSQPSHTKSETRESFSSPNNKSREHVSSNVGNERSQERLSINVRSMNSREHFSSDVENNSKL